MLKSSLAKQFQRFAISGLLVTSLHILVAAGLIKLLASSAPLANGIAFIVATVFSYTVNTLWSFSTAPHGKNLFRFICVAIIGCFLAVGVSAIAAQFGLHYLIGIGMVVMVVPPVTFMLHRFWTYQ